MPPLWISSHVAYVFNFHPVVGQVQLAKFTLIVNTPGAMWYGLLNLEQLSFFEHGNPIFIRNIMSFLGISFWIHT